MKTLNFSCSESICKTTECSRENNDNINNKDYNLNNIWNNEKKAEE